MPEDAFSAWLQRKYKFGEKSARDVVSRVKRASQFVNIDSSTTDEKIIFELSSNREFQKLSDFVRSQLKRAVKLYREHNRSKKK